MGAKRETVNTDARAAFHRTSTIFASIVIPVEFIVCIIIYKYIMGSGSHFVDNNPVNTPLAGDYLGMIYKGGITVPVLMTFFLVVITFFLERMWALRKAG